MLFLLTYFIFISDAIKSTSSQRRIVNGTLSVSESKYLVYFVKAPQSIKKYIGWICGGTIIHPLYILTSAACLNDVKHVFAIAGYNKYIKSEDIDKDGCTKRVKKRVVSRTYQKEFNHEPTAHLWSARDISLAKVESPYNFRDSIYITYCSYTPATIPVNFISNFEKPGTEAVTFGWGHRRYYGQDQNADHVNYASTVVIDKKLCQKLLDGNSDMKSHVQYYLLCTSGAGTLDEKGKMSLCARRMGLGNESVLGKNYLVYFVKSQYSKANDDNWICAGAIVTPTQILTAAACLIQMDKIYAIAGYKKYVHGNDIEKDMCTRTWKKKVVKISVPKVYNTPAAKQPEWMNLDIGVAIVEEPYNFTDQSYRTHCSYTPQSIFINFDKINELEKTRAVALGWGGKNYISPKEQLLREATTVILGKKVCANLVPSNESKELVNKYMLCASGNNLVMENDGETTLESVVDDCPNDSCLEGWFDFRRKILNETQTGQQDNSNNMKLLSAEVCQNDHGGPLISWVGTQQMMLGVALDTISKPYFDCVGPRIYVSTAETEKIIKCLLERNDARRKSCNELIDDERYQINDINIIWPNDLITNLSSPSANRLPPNLRAYVRQGDGDEPLHVRPTKELGNMDKQGNKGQQGFETQPNNPRSHPYYQIQGQPMADQAQRPPNEQYRGQPQGPLREQMQQSQMEPQQQVGDSNSQMASYNQPQMELYNQEQIASQNQPQMQLYNQAPAESYNQPPIDSYNQPQIDSYNQPQIQSQNPPQVEAYGQPPIMASYNNQQMDPYNQPQMGPYNQAPYGSYNQPPINSYNQPQIDSYNQQQDQSIYNKGPLPPYKSPQMESYKLPQDAYNQPQMGSINPSQADSYNQPEDGSFKRPQSVMLDQAQDPLKLSQINPFKQPPLKSFNQPEEESYNKTESESFKSPLSKKEVDSQVQNSYMEPQSSYNHPQIETLKALSPTESYNPLEILSDRSDEDLFKQPPVDSFKPPAVESLKPPAAETFKTPLTETLKPLPVQPYQQPNVDQYTYNSFKYAPVDPYEQSRLRLPDQKLPHQQGPYSDYQHAVPFGQPVQASAQLYDTNQANVLRKGPPEPIPSQVPVDSSHDESQIFEQMYSQLQVPGVSETPASLVTEQTFEELYKNLHDGSLIPQDADFESHLDPIFAQPADQPSGQQSYLQPFDQSYDRGPKTLNGPPMTEKSNDEVKVRPQIPLDYSEYLSYSRRRANTVPIRSST